MFFNNNFFNNKGKSTMAEKRIRKEFVRIEEGKINKAAQLREFLRENPKLSYADATAKFEALGLQLTSAQFYSIRREMQEKTSAKGRKTNKQPRKKITPAKPPVSVAAKSAPCTMEPQTAAEIYGDPSLSLEASTQPPDVTRTLQARNIIERAYLEAWQLVGQNYDLVDVIVDDVQEKHRTR